jgi:hypothetical protein
MLSQADANGRVYGSVPGLARIANISLDECEVALARFQAPDQYSRTQDFEGRRIRLIDGGWELINHAKYSKTRSADERNAYMAKLMADKRAREKEQKMLADVSSVLAPVSNVSAELAKLAELAPPALTQDTNKRDRRTVSKKGLLTLSQWTELNPDPDYSAVYEYADKIGLPPDFLDVAFFEFEEKFSDHEKRYKDWKQVLLNYLRGNWLKLWFRNDRGEWQLNTAGEQARAAMLASRGAA